MDAYLLVGAAAALGMLATLMLIDAIRCVRRRWQSHRPPVTRGQLHLFDDGGDHFLSAKLPVEGLKKLLDDFSRGRLG